MQTMVPLYGFGGVPYSAVRKAAPRNLLDNSDFRNPVNQRGITYGANRNSGYTIDRWYYEQSAGAEDGYFGLTEYYVSLLAPSDGYSQMYQNLEKYAKLKGKNVTFAALINRGSTEKTVCVTFTLGSIDAGLNLFEDGSLKLYSVDGLNILIRATGAEEFQFIWAALYEGEYTAETLPEYQPKGYGAELLECQRYYLHGVGKHCPGLILADGSIKVFVPTPVTMRITPTATAILLDNAVYNNGADRVIALNSIASIELKPTGVYVVFNTALTAGQDMFHTLMTFGTTLHLSADL